MLLFYEESELGKAVRDKIICVVIFCWKLGSLAGVEETEISGSNLDIYLRLNVNISTRAVCASSLRMTSHAQIWKWPWHCNRRRCQSFQGGLARIVDINKCNHQKQILRQILVQIGCFIWKYAGNSIKKYCLDSSSLRIFTAHDVTWPSLNLIGCCLRDYYNYLL